MFIGELTALTASLCWTISSSIVERKGKSFSAISMNFARQIIAFVAIGILVFIFNGTSINYNISFNNLFFLAMSGLIGFSLGDSFLISAFTRIGAQITLLIFSLSPVLAGILGRILFDEKLSTKSIVGMMIVIFAIMLVIVKGGNSNMKVKGDPKGLVFAFLASVGQAVGVILTKAGLGNIHPLVATEIRLFGGLIGIIIICSLGRKWLDVRKTLSTKTGITVNVGNAIIGTTMGVVFSMFAIKYTKVAIASTLMAMSPIMIIPISRFYFKEKISKIEVFGAILSVIGVALLV